MERMELLKAMKEMMESQKGSLTCKMGAERKTNREEMLEKMDANQAMADANQKKMKTDTKAIQEKMDGQMACLASRIEDNNEKFEVLQSTLVSRMDRHQEKMEAAIHSLRA
jgi:hypothetical protein